MMTNKNVLTPDSGKVLTDGQTYSKRVVLGRTGNAGVWKEIPESDIPVRPPRINTRQAAEELPLVKAELDRYKLAVAEVTAINTSTALKTTLVDAVNRLKTAVAPIAISEPIVKG